MQENQNKLFKEVVQFHPGKLQKGGGSGLGLYSKCILNHASVNFIVTVTKGLVDLHFGKIFVSSEGEGLGCTFTVEVPLHTIDADVARVSTPSFDNIGEIGSSRRISQQVTTVTAEPTTPLHVLVVDDALSNRKMLVRLLEKKGHSCDDAEDGAEGVMKFRASAAEGGRAYDVILMDFQMPEMDGPTAIKVIRSEGFRGVIIGVTGNTAFSDKETMLGAGADSVLDKPFNIGDFDELIRMGHII